VSGPLPRGGERGAAPLTPLVRLLLWDYERGSLAYDLAFIVVFLVLLLVPAVWWGDPMAGVR
jgi:hypothetical protein